MDKAWSLYLQERFCYQVLLQWMDTRAATLEQSSELTSTTYSSFLILPLFNYPLLFRAFLNFTFPSSFYRLKREREMDREIVLAIEREKTKQEREKESERESYSEREWNNLRWWLSFVLSVNLYRLNFTTLLIAITVGIIILEELYKVDGRRATHGAELHWTVSLPSYCYYQ